MLGVEHGVIYHGDSSVYAATMLARDETKGTARIRIEHVEVGHAFLPAGATVTVPMRRVLTRKR